MTRLVKFIGGFAVVAALALPLSAQADDKDAIDYRQSVMKILDAQTASLGMIVSTQIPPDNLIQHTEAIARMAKAAKKSFEAKVAGGESKPEIWANSADFNAKMDDFVVKTELLAKSAKDGGIPVVMDMMVDALTCKGCHDTYRNKK